MARYGVYDYQEAEITKLTLHLQRCARAERIIHYNEAFEVVSGSGAYGGPHDKRLWDLLGLISEQEVAKGRCALSALVVLKTGQGAGRPGQGFFELERKLNRYKADDDATWLAEIDCLFGFWRTH